MQVAVQPISADYLPLSAKRFTIYPSPDDKAIGFAGKLFHSSRGRVGTYGPEVLDEHLRAGLEFGKNKYSVVTFSGMSDGLVYGESSTVTAIFATPRP